MKILEARRAKRPPPYGAYWPAEIRPIEVLPTLDVSREAIQDREHAAVQRIRAKQAKRLSPIIQELQPAVLPSGRGRKKRKAKA